MTNIDYVNFTSRRLRTEYVAATFEPYLTGRVLDVGCDRAHLKTLLPGVDYTGIDIGGTPDVQIDLDKVPGLPFGDGSFDCVLCADVLEHLDNLHRVFAELLRVSRRYVLLSLPGNWTNARVPLSRGYGHFKHYGLPADKPVDRHKWFFSMSDAREFVAEHVHRRPDIRLVEERICEKPRVALARWGRRIRYPREAHYLNRYAHTVWSLLERR